jgi:arginyl-tRNA synthetase
LWHFFVTESKKEFQRIYERLGVSFEYELGESFYNDKMQAVIDRLSDIGILEESEGAMVVRLDEESLPPCLIVKSDGSSIYATRDLATAIYRHDTLKADLLLYVVGGEQAMHFRQVFGVLDRMGQTWAASCEHIPFGLMRFEGKKMSTRKGRVVFLEEVLDEAVARAQEIVNEKNPGLADKEAVAEAVGVGAIVFGDLKNDRQGAIDFSIEEAVRFEGETGPYVQYAYARIRSLLAKSVLARDASGVAGVGASPASVQALTGEAAWALLKQLMLYPSVLRKAAEHREPSFMARHLLEIAKSFNRFYHAERVLTGEAERQLALLQLCEMTGSVIGRGLELLGVRAPARI